MLDVDLHHSGKRRPQPATREGDEMQFLIQHKQLSREDVRLAILSTSNKAFWRLVEAMQKDACTQFKTVIRPLGVEIEGVPLHVAAKPCLPSHPAHIDLYLQTLETGIGEVALVEEP